MKSGGAAYSERTRAQFAESATSVFQHLGEVSQRLMELQAQAAAIVLMESAARYTEVLESMLRNFGVPPWMDIQRSQLRDARGPLEAWMEATTGLQAVLAAAFLQALALTVFPDAPAPRNAGFERRFNSVVIPFPDRRRHARF